MSAKLKKNNLATRFRGLLPVIIDVETSGLNPITDGLLEIAAVTVAMDEQGRLYPDQSVAYHIEPFVGANLDPESLAITGINPDCPLRYAVTEQQALHHVFSLVKDKVAQVGCQRAVLVGHNAWFDLAFVQAAMKRCYFLSNPFHSFTTFDTATLAAVALGETVLAKAVRAAKISFNVEKAHSALYDAEKTAELFCCIVNRFNFFSDKN